MKVCKKLNKKLTLPDPGGGKGVVTSQKPETVCTLNRSEILPFFMLFYAIVSLFDYPTLVCSLQKLLLDPPVEADTFGDPANLGIYFSIPCRSYQSFRVVSIMAITLFDRSCQ